MFHSLMIFTPKKPLPLHADPTSIPQFCVICNLSARSILVCCSPAAIQPIIAIKGTCFHFPHTFHPRTAAAAARRPHIHTSVLCDLQLLSAEHPRPLQASGDPAHRMFCPSFRLCALKQEGRKNDEARRTKEVVHDELGVHSAFVILISSFQFSG